MKKISILFVVVALFCAQIVKANPTDGPKGYGFLKHSVRGTLEPVEFQNAMKVLFTEGSTDEQIAEFFVKIEGFSFKNMKEIYRTSFEKAFEEEDITDAEMLQIIAKMKFREVGPEYWKTHSSMFIPPGTKRYSEMEWWNPTKDRPGEYIGSCKLNGVEKDLVTTYCANPVKDRKITVKEPIAPKVEKTETEVVILPGTNKYFYKTDTIRERNDVYKEVQNNFFLNTSNNTVAKTNNQSFTVDMESENREPSNRSCDCPSVKRETTHIEKRSCGCDEDHICQDHYKRLPKKVRKPLGQRTWFRVGTHAVAFVAGWFGHKWFDKDNNVVTGEIFTHGPFDPLPATNPIYTHAPVSLL